MLSGQKVLRLIHAPLAAKGPKLQETNFAQKLATLLVHVLLSLPYRTFQAWG